MGQISISASFDPEKLREMLRDPEVQEMLVEADGSVP